MRLPIGRVCSAPTVIILRERENTGLLESAGKFPD